MFRGGVHGHLPSSSRCLSRRQRNARPLASRHRAENLPQPIVVGSETLSTEMDLTLWLARFHCTEFMGISCTSPRRGYRLSARQTGRAAALSADQGKLLGQVACHRGTQRKRAARATAVDRVRSLLEAVLCADMTTGVVVVTYNSADVIGRCLASCRQLPIVVIDNHSEEETVNVVRQRSEVKLIVNLSNLGFAAAVNQGVEALDTELILLLNPDVELSTSIERLVEACSREGVGLASGKLIDETGKVQAGFTLRRFPTAWTLALEVLGINHLLPSNPVNRRYRCLDVDLSKASEADQPPGAFLMFRREVWHRLGGFDTQFHPLWFEDVDFSKRARVLGLQILYLPEVTAPHLGGKKIGGL